VLPQASALSGNSFWSRAWSGGGNGSVAFAPRQQAHRYTRCRDDDCLRLPCVAYRDGYDDGYGDGYQAGSAAGYAAGQASAAGKNG
jgi:hypothetical protein